MKVRKLTAISSQNVRFKKRKTIFSLIKCSGITLKSAMKDMKSKDWPIEQRKLISKKLR